MPRFNPCSTSLREPLWNKSSWENSSWWDDDKSSGSGQDYFDFSRDGFFLGNTLSNFTQPFANNASEIFDPVYPMYDYDSWQSSEGGSDYISRLENATFYIVGIVAPLLIVGGTAGNILAFVVLQTKAFRGTLTSVTLSSLAVVDTLILIVGLLDIWFVELKGWSFSDLGSWACKTHLFLVYFLDRLSPWIIVQVTVQRAIMILMPVKGQTICCRRNGLIAWAVIAFLLASLDSHFFFTGDLVADPMAMDCLPDETMTLEETKHCFLKPHLVENLKLDQLWNWIDLTVVCLIPFTILIITNSLVVFTLTKKQKQFTQSNRWSSITRMLLTVSFVFLVATLPSALFLVIQDVVFPEPYSQKGLAESHLVYTFCTLLFFTNNAINFFLYVISGRSFSKKSCPAVFSKARRRIQHTRCSDTRPKGRKAYENISYLRLSSR